MVLLGCTGEAGPAGTPCTDAATGPECSSDTGTSSSTSAGSSEAGSGSTSTTAPADDSSTGASAAFSILPPFDVVGAEWVYRYEQFHSELVSFSVP